MRRHRSKNSVHSGNHFWQSYSDIMAALLLVFVLVLTGTILQAQEQFEQKQLELDRKQVELDRKQTELDEAFAIIKEQEDQLEKILGIRQSIIDALKKQFTGDELKIDPQTGSIVFNADLMFQFDSAELSPEGIDFLNKFLPKYFGILLSDQFFSYVAEITIEGHTDTKGSYMYNLNLSQDRARNVALYFLADKQKLFSGADLTELRKLVTANGRSESEPILNADGTVNMDASRRVEIQFRLKDDEMIKQMLSAISTADSN